MSAIEKLQAKIKELKTQLKDEVGKVLKSEFQDILDKFPKLESFGWAQYTPGFCDGDPCYFSVSDDIDSIYLNGNHLDNYPEEEVSYDWKTKTYSGTKVWLGEAADRVSTLVGSLVDDDETLKQLFGDPVLVTVTREEIQIDEYECGY